MRPRLRLMVLEVNVGGDKRLPETVQIGVAVRQARRFVRGKGSGLTRRRSLLSSGWLHGQPEDGNDGGRAKRYEHAPKSATHLHPPVSRLADCSTKARWLMGLSPERQRHLTGRRFESVSRNQVRRIEMSEVLERRTDM